MLQSSPARQLAPSISRREPCAVPGAHTGSHPPPLPPTGSSGTSPLIPRGWLQTPGLTEVTARPSHPPSAHKDQVREGRKAHANSILNTKISILNINICQGWGVRTHSHIPQAAPEAPAQGHSPAPVLPPPPVLWLRISQGCSRCVSKPLCASPWLGVPVGAPQCSAYIYIYIYNIYISKYSTVKGREVLTEARITPQPITALHTEPFLSTSQTPNPPSLLFLFYFISLPSRLRHWVVSRPGHWPARSHLPSLLRSLP